MNLSNVCIGSLVLVSGLLSGVSGRPAEAGTIVTINFSGTETGVASPRTFSGSVVYDSSQPVTTPAGTFNFAGAAKQHEMSYKLGSSPEVFGSQSDCEPFKITTSSGSKKTFKVIGTLNGNTVTITLPTGSVLSQSQLPTCVKIPGTPLTGSTFAVSGSSPFTGNITSVTCEDD
jgi:hypothetical protein